MKVSHWRVCLTRETCSTETSQVPAETLVLFPLSKESPPATSPFVHSCTYPGRLLSFSTIINKGCPGGAVSPPVLGREKEKQHVTHHRCFRRQRGRMGYWKEPQLQRLQVLGIYSQLLSVSPCPLLTVCNVFLTLSFAMSLKESWAPTSSQEPKGEGIETLNTRSLITAACLDMMSTAAKSEMKEERS